MPTLAIYSQHNFPLVYEMQALAFMCCEWPSIFYGENLYMAETYPPELDLVRFVIAEGET